MSKQQSLAEYLFDNPKQFRWARFLYLFYNERLTTTGKSFLLLLIIAHSFGITGTVFPPYLLAIGLAAFTTACILEGFWHRPKQVICNHYPAMPVTAGSAITWKTQLKNEGPRMLYNLEVICPLQSPTGHPMAMASANLPPWLSPGSTIEITLETKPVKRGIYHLKRTNIYSGFPFGLFKWKYTLPTVNTFTVYPAYRYLEDLDLKFGRKYQPGGIMISSNVGDSVEFMGVREFVEGDNPKHVHWPSLAKTGKPGVKEFHEEYFVRLGLLIDGETQGIIDSENAFEAAISITASVADWIARKEYIIDIFATGNHIYHLQAGRSLAYLDNILDILACLEPCAKISMDELASAINPHLAQLSAIVCVFLHWDQEREKFVSNLLNMGLGLKILLMSRENDATKNLSADLLPLVTVMKPEDWEQVRI